MKKRDSYSRTKGVIIMLYYESWRSDRVIYVLYQDFKFKSIVIRSLNSFHLSNKNAKICDLLDLSYLNNHAVIYNKSLPTLLID